MSDVLNRLSPLQTTVIGVATGMVDVSTTLWLVYLKNTSQQRRPIQWNPMVMYRGYPMAIINASVLIGSQFLVTGIASKVISTYQERPLNDIESIIAGCFGGGVSGLFCGPFELTIIQQQNFGTSLITTPKRVISLTGLHGMSRGLMMCCCRESLFCGATLGLGPVIKRYSSDNLDMSANVSKVFAAFSTGILVASLSHPFDTIKTCQQGDILKKEFGNISQTFNTLRVQGGISRFYRGYGWRTSRFVLQCFLFDECRTFLSETLFPQEKR